MISVTFNCNCATPLGAELVVVVVRDTFALGLNSQV